MSTLWKAVAENLTESPTWIVAVCGKKSIASVLSFGSMNFFCGLGRQALVDLLGQRLAPAGSANETTIAPDSTASLYRLVNGSPFRARAKSLRASRP